MRSTALLGLAALAGCNQAEPPKDKVETIVVTNAASSVPQSQVPGATPTPPPVPTPPPTAPYQHMRATGTEPFWGMEVLPGQLRYSSPDLPDGVTFAATSADGLRFAGLMNGTAVTLVLAPGLCSDGMSDRRYPYSAVVTLGPQTLRGCARAE